MHAALAAAYGQLGEREAAAKAVRDLLKLRPDFAGTARKDIEKWWEPAYVERLIDGWRKAGLEIGESAAATREEVAIAVLPFSDMSAAKDQEYLCEGMAEEIMNALVRVDGIRVASRTSAFRARKDGGDLAAIARALSVGHVLEGSVRTSGTRLRVTAQLTDVASGYQLWSQRFDRRGRRRLRRPGRDRGRRRRRRQGPARPGRARGAGPTARPQPRGLPQLPQGPPPSRNRGPRRGPARVRGGGPSRSVACPVVDGPRGDHDPLRALRRHSPA